MNAEISSGLAAAAVEANDALGETVSIDEKEYTARVQTIGYDPAMGVGGEGESGQFKIWITKAALPTKPNAEKVTAREKELDVMLIEERQSTWVITAGDKSIE